MRNTKDPNTCKISVVTVIKDDINGLQATFNSLVSQNYDDYEWVVVDGGSGETVVDFLKSVSSDKMRWISESDDGIYDAMNKGAAMCSGDYVVFMNAGDVFFNSHVLADVNGLLYSLPDALFGTAQLVFPNGNTWLRKPKQIKKYIWHGMPANHQATYYKRESLPVPPYDSSYRICGDYYIVAMMYLTGASATYTDKPLVSFKMDGVSFHNPLSIIIESNKVQKTVLKLHMLVRFISALKRTFSISMTMLLNKLSF